MGKGFLKKYSYDLEKIVVFDYHNFDERYILDNGKLSKFEGKSLKGDFLLSTYLSLKDVISYSFEMEKTLLEKVDIDSYVETKSYEEAGLDETQEYLFKYKILDSFVDEKMLLVEVVIVSKDVVLEKHFEPILSETNYIDYVAYPGFLFDVLYKTNILEIANDLFIYFTKNEIFMTIYSEGKFLQTLSIPDGLNSIFSKISDLNIKDFDYITFVQVLIRKGLDQEYYNEKEKAIFNELSEVFSNIFLLVSNQIFNIKRKFNIENIDRVFIGSENGTIPGISEFSNLYLGVESNDLRFDKDYNPDDIKIEQLLFLTMLSTQMAFKLEDQVDNFSIYHRPATFFYRSSGQLITSFVVSIILSAIYPTYQIIDTYIVNSDNEEQQKILNQKNSEYSKLNNIRKSLENKKKNIESKIEQYKKDISKSKSIIDSIYKEKLGYRLKTESVLTITKYLNETNVKLVKFSIDENGIAILSVKAKKDFQITNFVNRLINGGYPYTLTGPLSLGSDGFYISQIKVQL